MGSYWLKWLCKWKKFKIVLQSYYCTRDVLGCRSNCSRHGKFVVSDHTFSLLKIDNYGPLHQLSPAEWAGETDLLTGYFLVYQQCVIILCFNVYMFNFVPVNFFPVHYLSSISLVLLFTYLASLCSYMGCEFLSRCQNLGKACFEVKNDKLYF